MTALGAFVVRRRWTVLLAWVALVALGFTASTGGADAMGFAIDTVSFELLDATCP